VHFLGVVNGHLITRGDELVVICIYTTIEFLVHRKSTPFLLLKESWKTGILGEDMGYVYWRLKLISSVCSRG
jgi:hypothetical protein